MTLLALLLLLLAAAAPATLPLLRRWFPDPVLPAAVLATVLLGLAAAVAAADEPSDPAEGWLLAAALVLGVAAATTSGGLVVRGVFRLMREEWRPWRAPRRAAPAPPSPDDPAASDEGSPAPEAADAGAESVETVLRGGAWIGFLERGAVAATLLAGWPEGIALVLAVKGVGRYSELREANAPEAFIIGTLASLLWAGAAAGTAQLLR